MPAQGPLQALGYVGFGSVDLDGWRQFGTGLVGLQAVERSASLLAFRMDDRKQRIVIDRVMPDGAASLAGRLPMPWRWTSLAPGWRQPKSMSSPSRKCWPITGAFAA